MESYKAKRLVDEREAAIEQLAQRGPVTANALDAIDRYFLDRLESLLTAEAAELGYAQAVFNQFYGVENAN